MKQRRLPSIQSTSELYVYDGLTRIGRVTFENGGFTARLLDGTVVGRHSEKARALVAIHEAYRATEKATNGDCQ
jgi:hypothetical protein